MKTINRLFLTLVALILLDTITTYFGVGKFNMVELNSYADKLFIGFGMLIGSFIKIIVTGLALAGLYVYIKYFNDRIKNNKHLKYFNYAMLFILIGLNGYYFEAVFNNFKNLSQVI